MKIIRALLYVFISSVVSSPFAQIEDPTLSEAEYPDTTFSGLYKIVNCGANQPARLNPEALQVKAFLTDAWQELENLLSDVQHGTASRYGYAALFKTNDSIATVSKTFQKVANGAPIPPTNFNPTLICLHADETIPLFQELYDQGCASGVRAAFSFPNLAHIGLCPEFFATGKRALDFPVSASCPILNVHDTMTTARYPLVDNRYAYFLDEMLHLYLEGSAAEEEHLEDGFPVQVLVDLNATASLGNVRNWVTYAMCE